jgi:hypothetical protein
VVDRKIIGVVGVGFAAVEVDLELGERVIANRSQGFLGVVATNRRLLAIGSRETNFSELRYRIAEKPVGPTRLRWTGWRWCRALDPLGRVLAAGRELGRDRPRPGRAAAAGRGRWKHRHRHHAAPVIAVSPTWQGFVEFSLRPRRTSSALPPATR